MIEVGVVGGSALVVIGAMLLLILLPGFAETMGGILNREVKVEHWNRTTKTVVIIFGAIFFFLGLIMIFKDQIPPDTPSVTSEPDNPLVNTTVLPTTPLAHTETPTTCMLPEIQIQTNVSSVITGQQAMLFAEPIQAGIQYSWEALLGTIDSESEFAIRYTAPDNAGDEKITVRAKNACGAIDDATLSLKIISPTATPTSAVVPADPHTPTDTPTPSSTPMPTIDTPATAQAAEIATATAQATETAAVATAQAAGTRYAATATANAVPPITNATAELQPGNTAVRFTWEWAGVLEPNMHFVVRFGQGVHVDSRTWTTDLHYELNVGDNTIFPKGQSYDWHIALIRDLPPLGGGAENDSSWEEIGEETVRSGPHAPIVLPHVEPTIAPPP